MKSLSTRLLSVVLAAVMAVSLLPESFFLKEEKAAAKVEAAETEVTLQNPRIVEDSSMKAGQKVTWDCVWFGSYPQTEIVLSGSEEESYLFLMNNISWLPDVAYQSVSKSAFAKISDATYDDNNDATVDGVTYHRMKKGDAKYSSDTYGIGSNMYGWTDATSWHYFRYDPIKWRVLSTDGEKALLLADEILDTGAYNGGATDDDHTPTWATSTVRSWLNNYDGSSNLMGTSYTTSGFLNRAFTQSEKAAIYTANLDNSEETSGKSSTSDQVFLLSRSEVSGTIGESYSYAGTVCSDGTVKSVGGSVESGTISSVKIAGISKKIAAGKKTTLKVEITPASASYAKIVWKSSNSKVATVDQNGVVTFKKKSGGKSVVITAKVVDESGETIKKATFKLKSMKGIVKKITIKGAKSIKAGKGKEVKIKIWPGGEIL